MSPFTNYDWDASGNLVRESDSNGATIASYYYAGKDNLIGLKKNNVTYIYHTNLRGDVVSVTDENGVIQVKYSYDPWGNVKTTTGSLVQPFRYAGYYSDDETGLNYLKSRYYSPNLGRFLTRDDYGYIDYTKPQTMNLYAYAGNDPVSNVDPTGFDPDDIGDLYREYLEQQSGDSDDFLEEVCRRMNEWDAKHPTGTFTDDEGNSYDYWNLTISGGPGSISLVRDKFGTYYTGSGYNEGKSLTRLSISFTFGQVEGGGFKNPEEASNFCSGSSMGFSGGYIFGIGRTYSNNRIANEAGFSSPQAGANYMYYIQR